MKYERMTSGRKYESNGGLYEGLRWEGILVSEYINCLVDLEDALENGTLCHTKTLVKEVLEEVWDATFAKEVGTRWVLMQIAKKYGVKLDRELKKYGEGGKIT